MDCDLKYCNKHITLVFMAIKMSSDEEFDYMSDNFLAEWYAFYEINSDI
jgi:hypothetical protein